MAHPFFIYGGLMRKLNLIIASCLAGISLLGIWFSMDLPVLGTQDALFSTKPAFYPILIFSGLLICAILMFAQSFLKAPEPVLLYHKDFVVILGSLMAYIIVLPFIGFIPSTVFFTVGAGYYLLAQKKDKGQIKKLLLINLALVGALYVLFVRMLNVPL